MTSGRLEKELIFYAKMDKKIESLPEIFKKYYNSMRANRKSYTTIGRYIEHVLHFAKFVTKDNLTEDFYQHVTSTDVEQYMISLETRQTKNGIQRTGDRILQTRWSSLNSFYNWLIKQGYIEENPITLVTRPKNNTQNKVTYLTKIEIKKLLRAIDNNPSDFCAMRDKTLIRLALATGLRISALLNLNIEDIDYENQVLKVIEKRQKIRELEVGVNTLNMLQEWIDIKNTIHPTPALFTSLKENRLSTDAANDMLKKYCEEAGIKIISFHKLRATAVCLLAKNNIPLKSIARQMGHNSTSTTQIYLDAFAEDNKRAMDVLDNLI